ncbi:MAG: hypothetical protein IJN91_04280 [Alphaproteobacteria bacterium]|nr:hypothetical protein [Alphaproteobacteria bacterium]
MNKKETFNRGTKQVITYGQVISQLNNIAKQSGNDDAYFSSNLISPENKKVAGFKFSSIQQRASLCELLELLGMRFYTHYKNLDPHVGELHIAPEHTEMAKKLFDNWCSWVIIEPKITGNKELDSQWFEIVGHSR